MWLCFGDSVHDTIYEWSYGLFGCICCLELIVSRRHRRLGRITFVGPRDGLGLPMASRALEENVLHALEGPRAKGISKFLNRCILYYFYRLSSTSMSKRTFIRKSRRSRRSEEGMKRTWIEKRFKNRVYSNSFQFSYSTVPTVVCFTTRRRRGVTGDIVRLLQPESYLVDIGATWRAYELVVTNTKQ
jgi:hypothetical protein